MEDGGKPGRNSGTPNLSVIDGIIFHLWSPADKVPSGRVMIVQSVGHVNVTEAELKQGAKEAAAAKAADER